MTIVGRTSRLRSIPCKILWKRKTSIGNEHRNSYYRFARGNFVVIRRRSRLIRRMIEKKKNFLLFLFIEHFIITARISSNERRNDFSNTVEQTIIIIIILILWLLNTIELNKKKYPTRRFLIVTIVTVKLSIDICVEAIDGHYECPLCYNTYNICYVVIGLLLYRYYRYITTGDYNLKKILSS